MAAPQTATASSLVHASVTPFSKPPPLQVIHKFVPDAPKGRMLDTEAAAEVYWQLYQQDRRCLTFEVDIRPFEAQW